MGTTPRSLFAVVTDDALGIMPGDVQKSFSFIPAFAGKERIDEDVASDLLCTCVIEAF